MIYDELIRILFEELEVLFSVSERHIRIYIEYIFVVCRRIGVRYITNETKQI